jgi:predicted permease
MTFIMLVLAIPMIYPVAHHYGSTEPGDRTVLRLVWESLIGIRAWGLYGSLVGLALALLKVPMPRQVYDWHILDALFFLSAIGGYFGIGMRLRLSDALGFSKQHVLLATMKFVAMPLATLAMILAVDLTPFPLPPLAWHVLLIESLMPAGISTVILANLFHLDARMGSTLWIWNTAVFLGVVLPALIWWYG